MNESIVGKKLLVLGGSIQCLKVVSEAKKLGVYTIVTDIAPVKQVVDTADEVLEYSVTDVDGLYNWCQKHHIDGIINYCIDYSQHTHQKLCDRLGFPCYGTEKQYHALTDKSAFKQLCRQNGVDIIPEYDEENIDEVEYPVLVKPAESSGSRGLRVCFSKQELLSAIESSRTASRNGQIIIEKFMGGKPDFTVTLLVIEGEPYIIRLGDRYLGKAEDGLDRQCICTISPSIHSELYLKKTHNNVVNLLQSLGICNGPVFFQGFIDDDKIRFYDPGIRFPGGEYDRLFYAATGINIVEAMIRFALTGKIQVSEQLDQGYLLNGKTAVQLTVTARPGTIAEYSGFDEIEKIPGIVYVARKSKVGAVIPKSGDVKQRVVEVDFLADGTESIRSMADRIYSKIHITDQNGEDMLVSKY